MVIGQILYQLSNGRKGVVDSVDDGKFSVVWEGGFRVTGYDSSHMFLFKLGTIDFASLGESVGQLVSEKQAAYGDSFSRAHEILRVLYPDGITVAQYKDMLALTRIIDKMFRIANAKDAFGESPYRDIAGYGLLGMSGDPKP